MSEKAVVQLIAISAPLGAQWLNLTQLDLTHRGEK